MEKALIDVMKREHGILKEQVALIKAKGVVTPAGFAELQQLKELLQEHIKQEDRLVYPRLDKAAERDIHLKALLVRFRDEMNEITTTAEKFLKCYTKPTPTLEFARDVGNLFSMLTNRIITEEKLLYPHLIPLQER